MSENSNLSDIIFTVRNDEVGVVYRNEFYFIGYLDITDNEKFLLETSNFNVVMTINSNEISIAVDRIVVNRLTEPNEIYNLNNQQRTIRCSINENIVNYNQFYYFASDVLLNKLRQLGRTYLKGMDQIGFSLNENDMVLDTTRQTMDLRNADQKRNRKFQVHFGSFGSSGQIGSKNSVYNRYVIDENCRFIRIEDHLIDSINLENAVNSIELKEYFPIIKNRLPIESTSDPKKKKIHPEAVDRVLLGPILPIPNVVNIKTQTDNIAGPSGIQSAPILSTENFQNMNATELNDIRENQMQLNESN